MTSADMLEVLDDHIRPHPERTEADRLLIGLLHTIVEEVEQLQVRVSMLLEVAAIKPGTARGWSSNERR